MASFKTFDPKPLFERSLTPVLEQHGFRFQKGRLSWKRVVGDESVRCAIKFWQWPWDEFHGSSFCVELTGSWPGDSPRSPERERITMLLSTRDLAAMQRCYRSIQAELSMPPDTWFVGREDLRGYYARLLEPVTLCKRGDRFWPFRVPEHVERWASVLAPILPAACKRFVRRPRRRSP